MNKLFALIAGILFGLGLALSGMINPVVVLSFLDIFGQWDPSLMFVMGGALAVTTIGFHLVLKRDKPMCESSFSLPTKTVIDRPLIIGASLFGIGWGLAGYCPGPAIAGLALGQNETLYFVAAMFVGFLSAKLVTRGKH